MIKLKYWEISNQKKAWKLCLQNLNRRGLKLIYCWCLNGETVCWLYMYVISRSISSILHLKTLFERRNLLSLYVSPFSFDYKALTCLGLSYPLAAHMDFYYFSPPVRNTAYQPWNFDFFFFTVVIIQLNLNNAWFRTCIRECCVGRWWRSMSLQEGLLVLPGEVGLEGVPKFFTLKVLQKTFIESVFTSWMMFTLNVPFYIMGWLLTNAVYIWHIYLSLFLETLVY